ncbi:transporter substrate-binding domain-containing protein [Pseudomonas sp. J452]|uniref:substrate-binding periplasmic protein n=1 Tax=Pseudomonas sp. J452 TaxID=2898441 RepID=UPI0021AE2BC4|nr:transporter substrate-binding domain-containing protein [Pseudomonas sp. J452]UUY09996.1 transporter substrate-binding domain-containing protein [Pseudomonas sp. J452]
MTATRLRGWFCALLCGGLCQAAQAQPLHLYTEEYPPINFSQNGQATGLATEVVREIMRRAGQSAPISVVPWARGYQQALVRANTGLFVTMRTPEREALFKWVGPLTRNVISFYALASSHLSLTELEQARHFDEIAVARGWSSHQRLLDQGFTNLVPVTGPAQMVSMLKRGRVKLMVLDNLSLTTLLSQGEIQADEVQQLLTLTHSDSYVAFSQGTDDALILHWQHELDGMKADGSFAAIYQKWLPGEPQPSMAPQP